jgi:ubiquinone/menaquinone biosynthesis C-methylase UbiE
MKHSNDSDRVKRLVRDHFRQAATSFDSIYDNEYSAFNRVFRRGLFTRVDRSAAIVRRYDQPRVLDVGCGSGRVAEVMMKAGVGEYVGCDFSEDMLELAGKRLAPYTGTGPDGSDRVKLVTGDFLQLEFDGQFDVILGLGLFDYLPEPYLFVNKMRALARGSVFATFPRWDWVKGPSRYVRYNIIRRCPIYNYTARELEFLFKSNNFSRVEIDEMSSGICVEAIV